MKTIQEGAYIICNNRAPDVFLAQIVKIEENRVLAKMILNKIGIIVEKDGTSIFSFGTIQNCCTVIDLSEKELLAHMVKYS